MRGAMTTLGLVACAVCLSVSQQASAQHSQPVEWKVSKGGNGHWYAASTSTADWNSARALAEGAGGALACTETPAEAEFLRNAGLTPERFAFVGLYQDFAAGDYSEPAGGWRWISGQPLDTSLWQPGEPNNYFGDERYGALEGPTQPAYLNDVIPGANLVYYIEWSADCNNDGLVDYGQILNGDLVDANANGVPDICESSPILHVPTDYPTIQAAIDSVPAGVARTILVAPGTYAPFSFNGKPLTVESTDGAASTTISASGLSTSAVIFGAGSTMQTTLRGFTVHPGAGSVFNPSYPWLRGGGGCFLLNGSGLIEDCVFTGGAGGCGYGGGVWSGNGNVVVRRCTFQSIGVEHFGGAIWVQPGNATTTVPGEADGTRAVIEDCVVRNCSSFNVGGVKLRVDWLDASRNMVGRMVVRRCDFRDNSAAVHALYILVWGVGGEDPNAVARIEDCVFRSPGGVVSTGYNDGSGGGTTEVDGCVIAAVGGAISRAGGALRVAN